MAPEGKGVIKVDLVSSYSYWKQLHTDRQRYEEEKQKVAGHISLDIQNTSSYIQSTQKRVLSGFKRLRRLANVVKI
jgi:hypothetical protein